MIKIAVILSGCGVFDGSEIFEATLSLLAIKKNNANYEIFAPDINQYHVINHISGEIVNEKRNVLVESARLARGKISSLSNLKPENFDAIMLPGGFGAAKNLSSYAYEGTNFKVLPELENIIIKFNKLDKPIAAICISPVLIAKIIKDATITIGSEKQTVTNILNIGGKHANTAKGEIFIDSINKIVTAPCFMLDSNIVDIAEETDKVIKAIIQLATS